MNEHLLSEFDELRDAWVFILSLVYDSRPLILDVFRQLQLEAAKGLLAEFEKIEQKFTLVVSFIVENVNEANWFIHNLNRMFCDHFLQEDIN